MENNTAPLSETLILKEKEGTKEQCIEDLRRIVLIDPEKVITRNYYRIHGTYAESAWSQHFGSFLEFKRQAGIILTRQQHQLERNIGKHVSVDNYRKIGEERLNYGDKYIRISPGRFKTILACSDLHDIEVDPFYLSVLLDTARRVQPDIISLVGDIFDCAEFGKYDVDPRDWDVVGRIRFVHEKIFKPLRELCPNAQIDLIEGNHENRLMRHMADATPALKTILSDLHGFSIEKLLGLDSYEINYIARCNMFAWNKRDIENELAKNYKIYYETVLVHHFPYGRDMGLPGVNGHHHRHAIWSSYSPVFGAYEWQQMGCGHRRSASYTEGEKWHLGFAIINLDVNTKATNFDYIPVTDFAISGGKWYYRDVNNIF